MRLLDRAVRLARLAALLCVSTGAFAASTHTSTDLARCARIADSGARLDCYDALAGKTSGAAVAAPAAAPPAAATPAAASGPSAPSAPAAPAAPAAFSSDPQNFGFTEAQRSPAAQAAPKAINARITKLVDSRVGQAHVELDNGQMWVFIDSDQDAGLRPQDTIVIKRGALGSYLLITPSHHSYHVRRTQ